MPLSQRLPTAAHGDGSQIRIPVRDTKGERKRWAHGQTEGWLSRGAYTGKWRSSARGSGCSPGACPVPANPMGEEVGSCASSANPGLPSCGVRW